LACTSSWCGGGCASFFPSSAALILFFFFLAFRGRLEIAWIGMGEVTSYFLGRRHEFWHQNHSRKISKAKPRGHTGGFMEWVGGGNLISTHLGSWNWWD